MLGCSQLFNEVNRSLSGQPVHEIDCQINTFYNYMMTELIPPEREETRYEIAGFYCPKQPLHQCDQAAPGNGQIITVPGVEGMQTYANAIEAAKAYAPICSVHGEPMIPQLTSLGTHTAPPSSSISPN